MTENLQQEERTDSTDDTTTEFKLLYNHKEDRLFLNVYTGTTNYMLELDENERDALRACLDQPPRPIVERD
jgi:hypothetical protein